MKHPSRICIPGLVLTFMFPPNTYIPISMWKKLKLPPGWRKLPYSPMAQLYRSWVRLTGKVGVVKDGGAELICAQLTLLTKPRDSMTAEESIACHAWEHHRIEAAVATQEKRRQEIAEMARATGIAVPALPSPTPPNQFACIGPAQTI